jgi:Flp pilus assembly protein TadG
VRAPTRIEQLRPRPVRSAIQMTRRSTHHTKLSERGQSLVLITVFMMSLLGMAALAIDAGSWYQTKRAVQAAADSSALAGASQLAAGWSTAQTAAQTEYSHNGNGSDTVTYQNTTNLATGDTVKVTASRTSTSFFAKLFGFNNATITATASATIESYTNVTSTGQVMPWGVMKASWTLGSQYSIYTDGTSPNNGALSLPVKSGSTCSGTSGGSDYKNTVNGGTLSCDVAVGQLVDVKTGQNTGPTAQGIDGRVCSTCWKTLNQIVTFTSGGQATVLLPNSPQLLLLPVVEALDHSSTWPSGSGQVRVIGFAWFVLTSPGYTNGGKTVLGTFVGLSGPQNGWSTGAFNSQYSTATTVLLTS